MVEYYREIEFWVIAESNWLSRFDLAEELRSSEEHVLDEDQIRLERELKVSLEVLQLSRSFSSHVQFIQIQKFLSTVELVAVTFCANFVQFYKRSKIVNYSLLSLFANPLCGAMSNVFWHSASVVVNFAFIHEKQRGYVGDSYEFEPERKNVFTCVNLVDHQGYFLLCSKLDPCFIEFFQVIVKKASRLQVYFAVLRY